MSAKVIRFPSPLHRDMRRSVQANERQRRETGSYYLGSIAMQREEQRRARLAQETEARREHEYRRMLNEQGRCAEPTCAVEVGPREELGFVPGGLFFCARCATKEA